MVLVVIPVHEREALVRFCFRAAAEMELPEGSEILVIDDASPALDVRGLVAETGLSCRYERMAERVGADRMVRRIWGKFLETGHSHLFFLDSDMVPNRDAVTAGLRLGEGFLGLISLYNSIAHAGGAIEGELVRKATVGNAATLWRRDLVEQAMEWVDPNVWGIDFAYCRAFGERGVPIAATIRSRVQHLGIYGTHNTQFGGLEHGLGFVPDSEVQWQAIGHVYDELMRRQKDFLPPAPRRDLVSRLRRLLGGKI